MNVVALITLLPYIHRTLHMAPLSGCMAGCMASDTMVRAVGTTIGTFLEAPKMHEHGIGAAADGGYREGELGS